MLRIINHKVLQSRTAAILVVLLFAVGSSGCATTLGYVPEQIKLRDMEDKNTFTPNYSEVKEWAYDVLDATIAGRPSIGTRSTAGRGSGRAVAGLTAFDTGSSVVKGFAIGGPVLGSIFAIYSSEEKARLYRLASSSIKELITLSDKRLLLCLHSTSSSVHEAETMEKQAACNLNAAKQMEETLGKEMQKARENADKLSASDSDKPGMNEVANAIDQKLREAGERVLVAEAELLGAQEDLKDAERCSQGQAPDVLHEQEALCLRSDVNGIMAKVEADIAQLDPRNVSEQLKSVTTDAAKPKPAADGSASAGGRYID